MSRIIVLGGGVCGLAAGLLLARDGHDVTLLERDPAPVPATPAAAWERWERAGVPQFRQAHLMQSLGRRVLASELPDVCEAFVAAGAAVVDPLARLPPSIADRDPRPGDDRLTTLAGRRPVLEHALGRAADAQPGLAVHRGRGAAALETAGANGTARVAGVRTTAGEVLTADLVVDAMGRGSRLPQLLAATGSEPPPETAEDVRFVYYTRFFRGRLPERRGPFLTPLGSVSIATLPADTGTWSVTIYAAASDRPLKRLRDPAAWTAVVRACPLQAHWLEGEPLTGVLPMGGIADRLRAAAPPVAGVLSVGDACACTNPSLGRGLGLGLMHAALLRDVVRDQGGAPHALGAAWREATERELAPWYRASGAADRARHAEMEALRDGRVPAPPDDPAGALSGTLPAAMARDADVFRAGLEIIGCLTLPQDVFARPGLAARVMALGAGAEPPPAPTREELLRLVA